MPTLTAEQFKKKYGSEGINKFNVTLSAADFQKMKEAQQGGVNKSGFSSNIKEAMVSRGSDINRALSDTYSGKINPLQTAVRTVGAGAGFLGDVIGEGVSKVLPDKVEEKLGTVINTVFGGSADKYGEWKNKHQEAAKDFEGALNIAALFPVGKAGETTGGAVKTVAQDSARVLSGLPDGLASKIKKIPVNTEKIANWFASEPSEQVKTILKETSTSKFDDYLNIAKQSSVDPRAKSVFEKVGDSLSDATKQIKKQTDSIGSQKSQILKKANVGNQPFTDAPRRAIIKAMKLEDNPIKEKVISGLKTIKTKVDADNIIDKIQSMVYDAKGTGLIASGSSIEKQIRGIIGELNDSLKKSLPESYKVLNQKYADRISVLNTLNRSLGEVVDGVPVRGASLIKQFFSPSGSKVKEIFEFVKKNTGVDLSQDAVVAKFLGDVFEDPKVKSLLESVPTSKAGIVNKLIDFAAEKSGAIKNLQNKSRNAEINKARDFTR